MGFTLILISEGKYREEASPMADGQDFHTQKIEQVDLVNVMRLHPAWSAWEVMQWLEEMGYDVWSVVEVGHSRNESHEGVRFMIGNSPEHVISRWMSDIRLNGEA
jgi:hypothetical protein